MTIMNNNYLDRHYKLEEKYQKYIKVRELLNQIIHSYIFAPLFEENSNKIIEIFITSDYTKDELVYSVDYQKIINLFTYISDGDMVGCSFTKEEKKKDGQTEGNKWDFVLAHAEKFYQIRRNKINSF